MIKSVFFCCFFSFFLANAKEQRIVTLAPNLTEIVYALNLGSQIVGDSDQCNYPKEAQKITKIGSGISPNLEKILFLRPTVVVATAGNPPAILAKLKQIGIRIIYINPASVSDLTKSIEYMAKELSVKDSGKKLSHSIQIALNELKKYGEAHKKLKRTFFFTIQTKPVFSISDHTWIGDLFTMGGFINVVGDSKIPYPIINQEVLLKKRPNFIFMTDIANKIPSEIEKIQIQNAKILLGGNLQGVKIVIIPKDILVRLGPRIIEGIHFIENLTF